MKRKKPTGPDDYFKAGPLEVARFGKNVFMKSTWPEGELERFQDAQIKKLPRIIAEIDSYIADVVDIISAHHPLNLMHRAYWNMLGMHMSAGEDIQETQESVESIYVLEYIQNIIASCPPQELVNDDISDADWELVKDKISAIYQKITREYLVCNSAKRRKFEPESNDDVESFRFHAQLHWMTVRGERYTVHEIQHLRDLILCHSQSIKSAFRISSEELVDGVSKILLSLTEGMGIAARDLADFDKEIFETENLKEDLLETHTSEDEILSALQDHIAKRGMESRQADIVGRFRGLSLFDLEYVTDLPIELLRSLSWSQGEDESFLAAGDLKGWPLRIHPLAQRPFLQIAGKFYCFNVFGLMDNLYRVIEKTIFKINPDEKQKWIDSRKINSEDIPLKYFRKLLPGCEIYKEVYYKFFPKVGSTKKEWCETDGLIVYGDHLIIMEIKAGSFTYTSPFDDFDAYVDSISNLVASPAEQGDRFSEYLKSSDEIAIYDQGKKNVIGNFKKSDFRKITTCALTIDPFTEIAAQIQHLGPLGISFGNTPVWSISLDDLRVCSEIFTNPLIFLHYLEQRMNAFGSQEVNTHDELDHVGLYFEFSNYSMQAKDMNLASGAEITFDGYRSKIDAYFHEKQFQPDLASPFKQDIPLFIEKLIYFCSRQPSRKNVDVSSYLLDCDQKCRNDLSEGIIKIIQDQPIKKRCQFLSTNGEVRISVACWQDWLFKPQPDKFLEYAKMQLLNCSEDDRNLLQIHFDRFDEITHVLWDKISANELSETERSNLAVRVRELKSSRLKQATSRSGKFLRNAKCPCRSGKKFKHCCGR